MGSIEPVTTVKNYSLRDNGLFRSGDHCSIVFVVGVGNDVLEERDRADVDALLVQHPIYGLHFAPPGFSVLTIRTRLQVRAFAQQIRQG
jgi:hypothetical protein